MSKNYRLQSNEVVVLKEQSVAYGDGFWSSNSHELMLTNLNLVLTMKGAFGNVKGTQLFPVNQIKVFNQRAQAIAGKSDRGVDQLEVYFQGGEEIFTFLPNRKRQLKEWVSKINLVVTGEELPAEGGPSMAIPGAAVLADVFNDTLSVFKSRRGSKTKESPVVKVAGTCSGCGAPISGFQGRVAICEYCDSSQQL